MHVIQAVADKTKASEMPQSTISCKLTGLRIMHRTLEVLLSDGEILKDSHKIYHLRLTHNQWGKEEVEIDFFLDPFSHQLGPLVPVVINF
jgi:hypothetical protein